MTDDGHLVADRFIEENQESQYGQVQVDPKISNLADNSFGIRWECAERVILHAGIRSARRLIVLVSVLEVVIVEPLL
jgi:hypothetical protein